MSLRAPVSLAQHRGHVLVTPPTIEPVTKEELRLHLRTDAADFPDAAAFITDARQEIETRAGIAFLTQTWRLALDRWPTGGEAWWDGVREGPASSLYTSNTMRSVELPRWPLASITSVTTYDEDGNSTAVTVASTFDVDLYRRPGRITLQRGATWPVALRAANAIEIVYVAGYTSAANVPSPMKRAVKHLAAYLYSHRGDDCDPGEAYVESGAESLLAQYKPARI
jgi:uncharacterized phiE125 gp8 family phage protein